MIFLFEFPDCCQIAEKRCDLLFQIKKHKEVVLHYLHANGDQCLPIFQNANDALLAIEASRKKFDELERDSEEFSNLMGRFRSISSLSKALQNEQNKISHFEDYIKLVQEDHGNLSSEELEALPDVRKCRLRIEEIRPEVDSNIDDLERRLKRANEILRKYK